MFIFRWVNSYVREMVCAECVWISSAVVDYSIAIVTMQAVLIGKPYKAVCIFGIYEPVPFFESKDEDWTNIFNINVMSGVRLTRHYMPKMLEQNSGRVIFISSESAMQIPTEMIHYGMTKTAQLSIANGLAQLTKGTGVTVNSVLPGPTFSEGVERFIGNLATQSGRNTKGSGATVFCRNKTT